MSGGVGEAERLFLTEGVLLNCRADGRRRRDFRPVVIDVGTMPQCSGSATVSIGRTQVVVGVRVDIEAPPADTPEKGRVHCTVSCGDRTRDVVLSQALLRLLTGSEAVDLTLLCIVPRAHSMVLFVDGVVLADEGNVIDCLVLAARCALATAEIPKVRVQREDDGTTVLDISDDPRDVSRLPSSALPVSVTMSQLGAHYVCDADASEERCADAQLTFAVSESGKIAIVKTGSGGVDPLALSDMTQCARAVGSVLLERVRSLVGL